MLYLTIIETMAQLQLNCEVSYNDQRFNSRTTKLREGQEIFTPQRPDRLWGPSRLLSSGNPPFFPWG
jgi:hypothetical protein